MPQLEDMVPMVSDLTTKSVHLSSVVDKLNTLSVMGLPVAMSSPEKYGRKEPEGVRLDDTQPAANFSWAKPVAGHWKPKRVQDTGYIVDKLLDNSMV